MYIRYNSLFIPVLDTCKDVFKRHSDADCILYDEGNCDDEHGMTELKNRQSVLNTGRKFGIESVSIREGCQLAIYTGSYFRMRFHISIDVNIILH